MVVVTTARLQLLLLQHYIYSTEYINVCIML